MIFLVNGSGRRAGNAARLLEAVRTGAGVGEAGSQLCRLAELDFRGCTGCGACRSGADGCVLDDGLTPVLHHTAHCDALILAAPIYYGYPSGLFKSYLDRWYGFRDGNRALRMPEGRPALLLLTQGHPDAEAYAWTAGSLEKVLRGYGFSPTLWVAPGLEGADAVDQHPELLQQARDHGAALGAARGTP